GLRHRRRRRCPPRAGDCGWRRGGHAAEGRVVWRTRVLLPRHRRSYLDIRDLRSVDAGLRAGGRLSLAPEACSPEIIPPPVPAGAALPTRAVGPAAGGRLQTP